MNLIRSACFAILVQALSQCAALAADVMPVWQNDTVANTLTFNDTFGHQVALGTYNPGSGAWMPSGSQTIIVGTSVITGTCPSGEVLTNAAGVVGCSAAGSGTVTSVALTLPSFLTVAGSPITTSGTFAVTATSEPQNEVLASPDGAAGAMTPRSLVAGDIAGIPGNLASGSSPITGTCTSGQVLFNNAGVMGCTAGGGSGTVTSVALTTPTFLTVTGSPVTGAGTLAVTATSEPQNMFLASPNGSSGAMVPRSITGNDLTSALASPPSIGSTTANTGAFTTLSASGAVSGTGFSTYLASPPAIGSTTANTGAFTTLSASSTVSGTGFVSRLASPGPIGNTAASSGAFTTLSASGAVSGAGITALFASPPAIGGTAPGTGAFTTLSASGVVSGVGFSNYLASPPSIGSTAPGTGAFTTLSASSTVSGSGITSLFASPPAIGNTAAASGAFTSLSASGAISGTGFSTYLASPPTIGSTTPNSIGATALSANTITSSIATLTDRNRSFQSFGATGIASAVQSPTITITIATPAVVTWTGSNLVAGQPVVFSTTGALPTGITAGTTYYVNSTGLTANSFQFCAAAACGGGSIATSGTQSGTQTAVTSAATISIASPGVVSWTAHGLSANQPIVFLTTGALPTGITAGTTYYVAATGLTANSFQFCAAAGCGGGSITTSGSQSGVQTIYTDDTSSIQTALNSGIPISCNHKFYIHSLITVTNTNINTFGGGNEMCSLQYNTSQSMIYITETQAGPQEWTTQTVKFKDIEFSINAIITSVTGPAQTAAIYVTYPNGTNGVVQQTGMFEDVRIKPTTPSNYILNGIYLNDATNVKIVNLQVQGPKSSFQIGTHGIVYDGTHSPTGLIVLNSYGHVLGNMLYAPLEATGGWQGIRVKNLDCVYCDINTLLNGSSDGSSDYADISDLQGGVQNEGAVIKNVTHAWLRDSYIFLANMPIPGGTTYADPTCFEVNWTLAIPANGASNQIANNTCDGIQVTGSTSRRGTVITGTSSTNMAAHIGLNMLTDLDVGVLINANTSGVYVEPQQMKGVTTGYTNNATAFQNVIISANNPTLGLLTVDANETKTGTETMTNAAGGAIFTVGTKATGSTTPTQVQMDSSYSSVAGANPKFAMFTGGTYGFGVASSELDYMAPTGAYHKFYINGVFNAALGGAGILVSTGVPTISACGTLPPGATANSSNAAGQFTTGTAAPTACTVTFATAFPTSAYCTLTPEGASLGATTFYVSAQSASAFTVTFSAGLTSQKFNYTCGGN